MERIGAELPDVIHQRLNYFTNATSDMLYLDGKGALLARLDHTLEEAKKHEFSEFILDKRFHEQDEIIQNEINRERNKSTFKERMDG